MLEAVPLGVERRVAQAVRAGEVDDDLGVRRLERRRLLVAEAEEDDVRAGGERLRVRRRTRAGSPFRRGSSAEARLPGERVRAERDRLEVGVREHPVERLLTRVSGAAEDVRRSACGIVCQKAAVYAA